MLGIRAGIVRSSREWSLLIAYPPKCVMVFAVLLRKKVLKIVVFANSCPLVSFLQLYVCVLERLELYVLFFQ